MASTGVLPFVKGIDFSRNDFSGSNFPSEVAEMTQMTWLKLNRANLERVPDELSRLQNLEHLQMSRNTLTSVHGELSDLPCLRSVIVRHNQVKTSGIPTDIFRMKDLTIIDFSHNSLKEVPPNLEYAKGSIVLNLSHNVIETVPNQIFTNLIDLIYLDLSNNKIEVLPPQIRRMTELQVLSLSNNPMQHFQLKQLPSMTQLRVLRVRNTQRTLQNIPPTLDNMDNLQEVDLAANALPEVPQALFYLKNLRRLDLSDNEIEKVQVPVAIKADQPVWDKVESLSLCRNKLTALPEFIVKMTNLRKLYVNENQLEFKGIPAGIGKLVQLEVFHAAYNNLELMPEGLARCVKLKRIKLNNNKLITLPASVHLLPDLRELDLRSNPELVMPPKPDEKQRALTYYNIDFSLENQLKVAGQSPSSSTVSNSASNTSMQRDPVARKIQFLKRRRHNAEADGDANKVIEGMSKVTGSERERALEQQASVDDSDLRPPTWQESIEKQKPRIDYSDFFEDDVGQREGLWVYEIENFYPNQMDAAFHGNFYEGDCYVVLKTYKEESGNLRHQIYYWIGEKSTLDKGMCAAVHAVNMRNHLGATCRTVREEMNSESDEFLELFGEEIVYIEGGRTPSGFFTVEKTTYPTRLYRTAVVGAQVIMEPVPVSPDSLDPRHVFLLDAGLQLFIWAGRKSRITVANKARLFAVRVNKKDRKGQAEIESCTQLKTPPEFWKALTGSEEPPDEPIVEHVSDDHHPPRPILYIVRLGMGFLELPQVELQHSVLKQDLLHTKCVYVLDCNNEVYLWVGKRASRLLKMGGQKIANEINAIIERPDYSTVVRQVEGEESALFKSKFFGWDDIVPFDFTRTAESVQRRGADLKVIMERDKMRTDLSALFLDRQLPMSDEEAETIMEECNEDLELMEPFVLEGRKFVRLPDREFGTFYTMDCYVFLCRYYVPPDEDEEADGDKASTKEDAASGEEEDEGVDVKKKTKKSTDEKPDDFQCVVYFWQGRDASNMGWLTFTFSLQKKFESLFKDKLEVVRMYQQQENHKFLSHFKKKLLIRRGRRGLTMNLGGRWPELFHMRANGSAICTRTIQVDCKAMLLNSAFCYVLRAPFKVADDDGTKGKVFVWLGKRSKAGEHVACTAVAEELINKDGEFPVLVVNEGDEPADFWEFLGGKADYPTNAEFMNNSRLFRCTNEKGFFSVSEKTVDFCQDDLDDDDIMILDNGEQVFLWVGSRASEVEVKLAYKAVQVFVQHLRIKEPDNQRRLMVTLKGRETKRFTKCFHAWGKHKFPAGE